MKLQEGQGFKICCRHIRVTDVRHSIMDSPPPSHPPKKWWIVHLLSTSTPCYPRSEWQYFTHVLLLKGWQLQTGMCKSRTGNILPSSSSLYSHSLSHLFFSIFFISRVIMGEGWILLKVCDVTEWLPFVNINLSFVTMLCRPRNHKICFTCQYNLDPSIRRRHVLSKDIYDIRYSLYNILILIHLNLMRHFTLRYTKCLKITFCENW
jgi:hypothetical protein